MGILSFCLSIDRVDWMGGAILKKRWIGFGAVFCLIVFLLSDIPISAAPGKAAGRLIQTMSEQDEYEGLLQLGLLVTPVLKEENPQKAYEMVIPSVVKLSTDSLYGSGVIFSMTEDKIIMVSCAHLLLYADEIKVEFFNNRQAEGTVVYLSQQYDLGFVEIPTGEVDLATLKELRQVRRDMWGEIEVVAGTQMFQVGSADGPAKTMYEGFVADPWRYFSEFNSYMINNNCLGRPGMSGGGTFDGYGNYIGMISGGLGEQTASLPLMLIIEEYQLYKQG